MNINTQMRSTVLIKIQDIVIYYYVRTYTIKILCEFNIQKFSTGIQHTLIIVNSRYSEDFDIMKIFELQNY